MKGFLPPKKYIKIGYHSWNKGKKCPQLGRKVFGEKSPHWKGGKVKKICQFCGKEFEVYLYRKDIANACSRNCKQKLKIGKLSPRWKGGINSYHARRARKMNASGLHTLNEWEILKAQYNWTCPCCYKKEPKIKLTEDHIIPLSKGGSNNIENIQPLCGSCNRKKYTKIIKYACKINS